MYAHAIPTLCLKCCNGDGKAVTFIFGGSQITTLIFCWRTTNCCSDA